MFRVRTECEDPALPGSPCVRQPGADFTCSGTSGNPGTPTTQLQYFHESGTSDSDDSTLFVSQLGRFNLFCSATYRHQACPEYFATCWRNQSGVVFGESTGAPRRRLLQRNAVVKWVFRCAKNCDWNLAWSRDWNRQTWFHCAENVL